MQLVFSHLAAQRCEGILDPGGAQSLMHRKLWRPNTFERQPQYRPHLGFVREDPLRVVLGHDLQALCRILRRVPQAKTTPLHVHAKKDEALYVLEGEILVHIDGTDHRVGPRGVAVAPRGVPHAFLVTSPTARVLTLQTPGSAESFYRGASEPASAEIEAAGPVDFGRVREAAERSGGMEVLGPPPFAPANADAKNAPTIAEA
jgi:quercetin dioxygenase-like cupin family protein